MLNYRIILIEDDAIATRMLSHMLDEFGYSYQCFKDGESGWQAILQGADVVLLDRNLPDISGIELIQRMRAQPSCQHMPVILHSVNASPDIIAEGLAAGAHYFLPKPVDRDVLHGVLETTLNEARRLQCLQQKLQRATLGINLLSRGQFRFKSLEEGRGIAALLANACPDPQRVLMGLNELINNAIEHGNLAISYDEKSHLLETLSLNDEVTRRAYLPEYKQRYVQVEFIRDDQDICISVTDEGAGFNWHDYVEFSVDRIMHKHGRGIAMSKQLSFDKLIYNQLGNQAFATINLEAKCE